jgi:hypothetical protein
MVMFIPGRLLTLIASWLFLGLLVDVIMRMPKLLLVIWQTG